MVTSELHTVILHTLWLLVLRLRNPPERQWRGSAAADMACEGARSRHASFGQMVIGYT